MTDASSRTSHRFSLESLENRNLFAADTLLPQANALPATESYDDAQMMLNNVGGLEDISLAHNSYGLDGTGQTVVIIDSGVAYDHPALGGGMGSDFRVVGGYDFAEFDSDPYDDTGFHGTHVAGIIGSSDDTYTGLAPGVDFVVLRVFNDAGSGSYSRIERALSWVHDHRFDFENPITTVNVSIGANWNSTTTPVWATLENELAQLKADGIFTTAASGNLFQNYQVPGLNYPAASPYVVPVGSIDANGNISSFSQRHSRMLVAPGESIMSTVPDHLYSFDGVTDDFANSTGTSMASPYIAGASVLLRQAMELAGVQTITQDVLYSHFMDTADQVFDGVTNSFYSVLNLGAALEAVLGTAVVDDYGSTAADAHDLGMLSNTVTIDGVIGTAGDVDFFEFTATASGTASFWADGTGTYQLDGPLGNMNADGHFEFSVEPGQLYSFSVSSNDVSSYGLNLQLTTEGAVEDLDDFGYIELAPREIANDVDEGASLIAGEHSSHARQFETVVVVATGSDVSSATVRSRMIELRTAQSRRVSSTPQSHVFAQVGASKTGDQELVEVEESLASGVAETGSTSPKTGWESTLVDVANENKSNVFSPEGPDPADVEDYFVQLGSKLHRRTH